jgi:hypothetical protein
VDNHEQSRHFDPRNVARTITTTLARCCDVRHSASDGGTAYRLEPRSRHIGRALLAAHDVGLHRSFQKDAMSE